MRYMLTGDHWSAEEAYRMGEVQQVAATPEQALEAGVQIANKIAACGPLGIKTTLLSAHLAVDPEEEAALSKLDAQFVALFHTQDFQEGRKAETRSTREDKRKITMRPIGRFQPMREEVMPFVEVFTREKLSDKVRTKLAEELSNTLRTVEVGVPTESAKLIDWMWFHTMPADSWAVGGRFDDTYVKGRKMAHARIIAPQGLMNAELKSRAVKEVARVLKTALGVGRDEDDTGIFTMCIEIDDGQWATGEKIPTLIQLMDNLGGYVSEQRRAEMSARYPQKR